LRLGRFRLRRASLALGVGRDLALAVIACGIGLIVLLIVQLGLTERDLRQRSLDEAAQYVAAHLKTEADGSLSLPSRSGSSWASFGYPLAVLDEAGHILFKRPRSLDPTVIRTLFQQRLRAKKDKHPLGAIRFFSVAFDEQALVATSLRVHAATGDRIIMVFKDENAPDVLVDDVVREFPRRAVRVLVPLFAALLIGGGWLVWRRIRPIARASAVAETIGPHTLNLRLPEEELPREVLPIVASVNGALARLEAAATAQREFLRRAAHQLRTPLTVLSARVDTLADPDAARQLRSDVHELTRIVSQLLQLNELDAMPEDRATLAELGAVAEAVRDEMTRRAARRDKRIVVTRPPGPVLVRGDPNLIEIAVRNLVENALQHAPAGSRVMLRVGADGRIEVTDAGPGVPVELREQIFEPFWSGDLQGARPGLGLTIVRRIAERCGAAIAVDAAPAGGASFVLQFQPAPLPPGELDPRVLDAALPASLAPRRRRAAADPAAT
jgi:signal transduction histidine kinase